MLNVGQESKLDKGIFEDLTAAKNILLKDLINPYIMLHLLGMIELCTL